jgi:hypothetical protein
VVTELWWWLGGGRGLRERASLSMVVVTAKGQASEQSLKER